MFWNLKIGLQHNFNGISGKVSGNGIQSTWAGVTNAGAITNEFFPRKMP